MRLEGRRAIVTGGSRGIGYQISKIFLEEGARVLAVSRDPAKLAGAQEQLPALETLSADVSIASEVDRIAAWADAEWGAIDILVNNAGVLLGDERGLTTGSDESFLSTLQVNVFGAYSCTKRLLPLLLRSDDPRIVNVGSMSGMMGRNMRNSYGVSKAALHALTLATANELRGKVAVNALAPGWVKTDMSPNGPGDPRWSAEGALSIVTRPADVTGRLFYGKRLRAWDTPLPGVENVEQTPGSSIQTETSDALTPSPTDRKGQFHAIENMRGAVRSGIRQPALFFLLLE